MSSTLTKWVRLPWVTAAVALAAVSVYCVPGAGEALQLDWRSAGEWWRVPGCQLSHWSGQHLWWDLSTFVAAGAVSEGEGRTRYLVCLLLCFTILPLLVYAVEDGVALFRGLSGTDCALVAFAAVRFASDSRRGVRASGLVALVALGAKVLLETASGQTLFVRDDVVVPVPVAHSAGAMVGAIAALLPSLVPSAIEERGLAMPEFRIEKAVRR